MNIITRDKRKGKKNGGKKNKTLTGVQYIK